MERPAARQTTGSVRWARYADGRKIGLSRSSTDRAVPQPTAEIMGTGTAFVAPAGAVMDPTPVRTHDAETPYCSSA